MLLKRGVCHEEMSKKIPKICEGKFRVVQFSLLLEARDLGVLCLILVVYL